MEVARIRSALADIERDLERARSAKTQIENDATRRPTSGGVFEEPEAALGAILTEIYERVLVVLEAAGLPETRSRFLERLMHFEKTGEMNRAPYNYQYDFADSKPYAYLSSVVDALRSTSGDEQSPHDSYELAQLETILRRTPVLVHRRGSPPTGEHDVQTVMHDYLSAFFTEYRHPIKIHGVIREFEPDGGVRNLRTAIEFKYAASKTEVSRALGGIFEDVSGYAGSLDWTRFYTVIYQTAPFESEDRIRSELTRAGVVTWKSILVTGPGKRKLKVAKVPPKRGKSV